jgi:hypothetical protein
MVKSLGTLMPAWSGDPGYYTGSSFIRPGRSLNAVTTEYLGLTINGFLLYYPFYKSK